MPVESRNHVLLEHEPAWAQWLEEVRDFLPATPGGAPFSGLTPREAELVELIAQGLDNAQIAARLELSDKTVRNHITSIFAKLGVDNRSRAIVLAREAGFGQKSALSRPLGLAVPGNLSGRAVLPRLGRRSHDRAASVSPQWAP